MSDTTQNDIYYGINEQILSSIINNDNFDKISNNNIFSINNHEKIKNINSYPEKIITNFFKKFTE
jgi:hypothetical protein